MGHLWRLGLSLVVSSLVVSPALAQTEQQKLLDRLLALPKIQVESGFTARVLIPPGQLYDPLWMLPRDGVVWLNDDGPEEGDKGSRLLSLDSEGKISVLAGPTKALPITGFDIAPPSFGTLAGQIFTLAQARVGAEGITLPHVIQRIDPTQGYTASVVCTLPSAGTVNQGIGGVGADARFGPDGSPFANKFFAVTAYNNSIYQATGDGKCTPFITFDAQQFGSPTAATFSADGQTMLVTVARGEILGPPQGQTGAVVRVSPDGKVTGEPMVRGLTRPAGLAIAPPEFGSFAGQLFVADIGNVQAPVPMTQPLNTDGKLYRVTPQGELHLVASGFFNPLGVRFLGNKLWVTDINGDFIGGKRELPDGFLVEIRTQ